MEGTSKKLKHVAMSLKDGSNPLASNKKIIVTFDSLIITLSKVVQKESDKMTNKKDKVG